MFDKPKRVLALLIVAEGVVAMGLIMTGNVLTSVPVHHFGPWTSAGMGGLPGMM